MESVQNSIRSNYDQVTAPASGTEPPSGVTGSGTVDQPYDGGNAPEQASASNAEPLSGVKGKGTIDQPYDQGNQQEQPSGVPVPNGSSSAYTTESSVPSSATTTLQGSGNPSMQPTTVETQAIQESRGRDEAAQRTTSTPDQSAPSTKTAATPSGHFDASKSNANKAARQNYEERDVSPGEMRDGSHVQTSGDKGESYTPGKFNKLKDKFGFGRDRH